MLDGLSVENFAYCTMSQLMSAIINQLKMDIEKENLIKIIKILKGFDFRKYKYKYFFRDK